MPIRVAHVMRTYGVHGGERQLGQLFKAFPASQFLHLFVFVYRDVLYARYLGQIQKLALRTLLPVSVTIFPSLWFEMAVLLFFLPILQFRMVYVLWRTECKVCVAHGFQGALVTWLAACVFRKIRFVYVHRGTKSQLGRHPVFKLIYRPFDVVAGVSKASADSLVGLVGRGGPCVLENGIDWEEVDRQREQCTVKKGPALVVCCVGRLLESKGQGFLLRAFASLCAAYPESEFWVIGDGPDRPVLEGEALALGIHNKVIFLGYSPDVVCLLAHGDIFVHASESEGLSNAVLEAMTLGLPSVVVDAPGVSECHIEGVTGFVVARDEQQVAQKLLWLAQHHSLRAQLGAQARKRVMAHYSIRANCGRYFNLYQGLLES